MPCDQPVSPSTILTPARPSLPSFLQSKLAPEVSRILYVKHLPFKITTEELYDLFGRYGAIRQIRLYVLVSDLLHLTSCTALSFVHLS